MTETLRLQDRELFWPPADELTETAERIRARLATGSPRTRRGASVSRRPTRPMAAI